MEFFHHQSTQFDKSVISDLDGLESVITDVYGLKMVWNGLGWIAQQNVDFLYPFPPYIRHIMMCIYLYVYTYIPGRADTDFLFSRNSYAIPTW